MGRSIDSHLVFGYYLGGEEMGWALEGAGEYGQFPEGLDWFDYSHYAELDDRDWEDDDEENGPISQFEDRLLQVIGGLDFGRKVRWARDSYAEYDAWLDEKRAAGKLVKVKFRTGGSEDARSNVLSVFHETEEYGDPLYLDFEALAARRFKEGWDELLTEALAALGIKPTQAEPKWFVFASYD